MDDNGDVPSDNASVESEHLENDDPDAIEREEGEGDDLYGDAFLDDYQPIPELDYYDQADLVVEDVTEDLNAEEAVAARRRAEEEMDARDRVHFRRGGPPTDPLW